MIALSNPFKVLDYTIFELKNVTPTGFKLLTYWFLL
jgi:hypothetical protein